MESYKIRVNNESDSKEAQELFFELGYSWYGCGKYYNRIGRYTFITAYPDEMLLRMGWGGDTDKEITLPQLRDLVVLKRNDVKDANYKSATDFYYITVENRYYFWNGSSWCLSSADFISGLSPIIDNQINQDLALISGADAKLVEQAKKFITSDHLNRFEAAEAHLEGHPVQFMLANGDFIDITSDTTLGIFEKDGGYSFRLKPQTIKLELELPKPFEPKGNCHVYILDGGKTDGYRRYFYEVHGDKGNEFIGIWKTEDEIKQVVEQLRKIKGAV